MQVMRALAVAVLILWLPGCDKPQSVKQIGSPDGAAIVRVRTYVYGGPGNSSPPLTYIDITSATGAPQPDEIFNATGSSMVTAPDVTVRWLSSNELELAYSADVTPLFQAVQWKNVRIPYRRAPAVKGD